MSFLSSSPSSSMQRFPVGGYRIFNDLMEAELESNRDSSSNLNWDSDWNSDSDLNPDGGVWMYQVTGLPNRNSGQQMNGHCH